MQYNPWSDIITIDGVIIPFVVDPVTNRLKDHELPSKFKLSIGGKNAGLWSFDGIEWTSNKAQTIKVFDMIAFMITEHYVKK